MEAPLAIQEFIEYVVVQLIDHREAAAVLHDRKGNRHDYRIRLHPDDIGRVIGRNGATISAIRNLAMAAALKNELKITIEIEDGKG
ncbi:MAG: KH domain-containing protein [Akkermansiaceae bacterium]|nr:KH domain-containing protein [Akkermansiaceae bacterium]MCP5550387.1 KH domain-containing protein [Akkermansiaceae bacterium]